MLYRRAIELDIDRNDTIVRRRLAHRMRFLLEDTYRLEPPTDAQLRAWLEAHPERFTEPATTTFEHLFFSRGRRGADLTTDVREALEKLRADPASAVQGDPFFRGARFERSTDAEIRRAFGQELAEAMGSVLPGNPSGAARFVVFAAQDPDGAPLERIQIIKGKLSEAGEVETAVTTIKGAADRPDPNADCSIDATDGAETLCTVWAECRRGGGLRAARPRGWHLPGGDGPRRLRGLLGHQRRARELRWNESFRCHPRARMDVPNLVRSATAATAGCDVCEAARAASLALPMSAYESVRLN